MTLPQQPDCTLCPLHEEIDPKHGHVGVPTIRLPETPPDRPIALVAVGRNPGWNENLQGTPFVGRSGALLRKVYLQCTTPSLLDLCTIYLTNAVRCYTKGNASPTKTQLLACRPYMTTDLAEISAAHEQTELLVLGAEALRSVTGNGNLRKFFTHQGSHFYIGPSQKDNLAEISAAQVFRVWATYHPSYILRGRSPSHLKVVTQHLDLLVGHLTQSVDIDTPTNLPAPLPITDPP